MKLNAVRLDPETMVDSRLGDSVDFILQPDEVAKGAHAYHSYLESIRAAEARRTAADALDALAFVITKGRCAGHEFPWHQVRSHHGAAALTILREVGTPTRVESYRCEREQGRKVRRMPETYAGRQVSRTRDLLCRLLLECSSLGYAEACEAGRTAEIMRPGGNTVSRGRVLTESEFRGLVAACARETAPAASRDKVVLRFGYESGLRLSEIVAANLDDLSWSNQTGGVTLRVRGSRGQRGRSVPLSNDTLIAVEDWLEVRSRDEGPLLCPILRGNRIEIKRLKGAEIRQLCNLRAEKAGVQLFLPQDLRRRVAEVDSKRKPNGPASHPVSLFAEEAEAGPEAIQFP